MLYVREESAKAARRIESIVILIDRGRIIALLLCNNSLE
jgi:hypothetical protein